MQFYYPYIVLFLFGTVIGSFINAYSLRVSTKIPKIFKFIEDKELSYIKNLIVEFKLFKYSNKPSRSYCPICKNKLKWYHNIPLISYILLRGKCGFCNVKIPFIYFISEVLLGLMFSLTLYINNNIFVIENQLYSDINLYLYLFVLTIFYSSMIIDLKTTFIPDYTFVLTLIPIILISNFLNQNFLLNLNFNLMFNYLIIPIIFYYSMYLINFLTYKKINKIYIGFADLKLLSFIMIMYGFKNTIIIYFISAYISIFPILYIKFYLKNNKEEIPYGIYIFISFYLFSFYQPFIYNFLKM